MISARSGTDAYFGAGAGVTGANARRRAAASGASAAATFSRRNVAYSCSAASICLNGMPIHQVNSGS